MAGREMLILRRWDLKDVMNKSMADSDTNPGCARVPIGQPAAWWLVQFTDVEELLDEGWGPD